MKKSKCDVFAMHVHTVFLTSFHSNVIFIEARLMDSL
jgi:hypothetical protein